MCKSCYLVHWVHLRTSQSGNRRYSYRSYEADSCQCNIFPKWGDGKAFEQTFMTLLCAFQRNIFIGMALDALSCLLKTQFMFSPISSNTKRLQKTFFGMQNTRCSLLQNRRGNPRNNCCEIVVLKSEMSRLKRFRNIFTRGDHKHLLRSSGKRFFIKNLWFMNK